MCSQPPPLRRQAPAAVLIPPARLPAPPFKKHGLPGKIACRMRSAPGTAHDAPQRIGRLCSACISRVHHGIIPSGGQNRRLIQQRKAVLCQPAAQKRVLCSRDEDEAHVGFRGIERFRSLLQHLAHRHARNARNDDIVRFARAQHRKPRAKAAFHHVPAAMQGNEALRRGKRGRSDIACDHLSALPARPAPRAACRGRSRRPPPRSPAVHKRPRRQGVRPGPGAAAAYFPAMAAFSLASSASTSWPWT